MARCTYYNKCRAEYFHNSSKGRDTVAGQYDDLVCLYIPNDTRDELVLTAGPKTWILIALHSFGPLGDRIGFHYHLIRLKFNPKYSCTSVFFILQSKLSGLLNLEYIVSL